MDCSVLAAVQQYALTPAYSKHCDLFLCRVRDKSFFSFCNEDRQITELHTKRHLIKEASKLLNSMQRTLIICLLLFVLMMSVDSQFGYYTRWSYYYGRPYYGYYRNPLTGGLIGAIGGALVGGALGLLSG
ncbi:hypothetical protein Y032_0026g1361 [Ancylostoma ceylanicum]|uniref:Uncharacterized protein n=1 Tax=Ancylostoma ceylanicum TaxID=53326 RepID=A0A016UTL8_9BILA|nr:hypothetical protein Y032_0026g1361 [Ancylostoma ceylanicum]